MARLNEATPSLDAFETLKRRFIRQNREIARVNSTQSLRIRNLETEISRLLAENLAIREQAINVASKAHNARKTCSRCSQLSGLKAQLQAQLSDISAVVNGLDIPDKDNPSTSPGRRRSSGLQILGISGQDGTNFGGAEKPLKQALEGWMPPILENKHYPRKTLDADELKAAINLAGENSESPDIGPPPVAHFDVGDVGSFEPRPAVPTGAEDEAVTLPPNLERRRKRRASVLQDDMSQSSDQVLPQESAVTVRSAAGLKRKFSVRDDNEETKTTTKTNPEDFSSSRNRATSHPRPPTDDRNMKSQRSASEQLRVELSPRKALQPKTTNSPTKSKRPSVEDKLAALKEDVARQGEARRLLREKRSQSAPSTSSKMKEDGKPMPQEEVTCEPIDLPPKTPANMDVSSPPSTESSTSRATAPEIQAMPSVEDIVSNASRPSRRPRGAVSYAEPNLRDKMRRPTKELAPAVAESSRHHQRATSAQAESDSDVAVTGENVSVDRPKMRTVVIKRENNLAEGEWKNLPAGGGEAASPLVGKVGKHWGDEAHQESRPDGPAINGTDASTIEPSTGAPKVLQPPPTDPMKEGLGGALSKLSIFDGPSSSPSSPPPPKTDTVTTEKSIARSSSRRHSSNPLGMRRVASDFSSLQQQSVSKKRDPKPDIPARPSSAMDRREAAAKGGRLGRSESLRNPEGRDREREKSGTAPSTVSDSTRRGERTMARRRSMML